MTQQAYDSAEGQAAIDGAGSLAIVITRDESPIVERVQFEVFATLSDGGAAYLGAFELAPFPQFPTLCAGYANLPGAVSYRVRKRSSGGAAVRGKINLSLGPTHGGPPGVFPTAPYAATVP